MADRPHRHIPATVKGGPDLRSQEPEVLIIGYARANGFPRVAQKLVLRKGLLLAALIVAVVDPASSWLFGFPLFCHLRCDEGLPLVATHEEVVPAGQETTI